MVRFSTKTGYRLSNSNNFSVHYGGAEANVAINLSNLDHNVKYATKLPINNGLSEGLINQIRSFGVDTSSILYGEGRLGSYYLETGAGLRPANVIYDRQYSTIAMMEDLEWDLDELFENVSLFHVTGITLALSKKWHDIGLELIKEAKRRDVLISFDMNYRQKMWSQLEAREVYQEVLPYVDYLSAGKLDAIHFMKIPEKNDADWEYYLKEISNLYPSIQYIYGTNRKSLTPNSFDMTGYIWDTEQSVGVVSSLYHNHTVVDRVGTGDSYAAAVLDGIIHNKDLIDIVEFAIATSAMKHTIHGDVNLFNREEIEDFMVNRTDVNR